MPHQRSAATTLSAGRLRSTRFYTGLFYGPIRIFYGGDCIALCTGNISTPSWRGVARSDDGRSCACGLSALINNIDNDSHSPVGSTHDLRLGVSLCMSACAKVSLTARSALLSARVPPAIALFENVSGSLRSAVSVDARPELSSATSSPRNRHVLLSPSTPLPHWRPHGSLPVRSHQERLQARGSR